MKLCSLLFAACSLIACSSDAPSSHIAENLCVCEAASLGTTFSPRETEVCEARVIALLEASSDACVACLERTVGSSSAPAACSSARATCTMCKQDERVRAAMPRP